MVRIVNKDFNYSLPEDDSSKKENLSKNPSEEKSLIEVALTGIRYKPSKLSKITIPAQDPKMLSPTTAKKMVKQVSGEVSLSSIKPVVQIPEALSKILTANQLQELKKVCLEEYKEAMQTLEESVADVAVSHPDALAFAGALATRLFEFLEAYAEVLLENEGRIHEKTSKIRNSQIDLKVNELLATIFSGKETNDSILRGRPDDAGSVGMNPLSIRAVFKNGNLREQMYLPYKANWGFTNAIFKDLPLIEKVNQKLKTKDWQVDTQMIQEAIEAKTEPYKYAPYANQAREDQLRVTRPLEEQEQRVKEQNLRIQDQELRRIPLSERERRTATSELTPESTRLSSDLEKKYQERAQEQIRWKPGDHQFRISSSREREKPHEYLTAAEAVAAPGISGPSGSLDLILTMSLYFGMSSRDELEKGRLACLGWMVDGKDHTINEIMVASKAFGFDYTLSPTSYQQIYSQDPQFIQHIEEAQRKRNRELPDFYLSPLHIQQKAESLFKKK